MSDARLQGKVALITGATSGIGRQQALALASAGCAVIACGRREDRLQALADTVTTAGGQLKTLCADLERREQLAALASDAATAFGPIDILCNTAGVNFREAPDEITLDSWDRTLNLNLTVPFFLARELVPSMRERGWGRIINIASLQSRRAFANGIAYGASKGGVDQLTRAMAQAWSADGINANAIAPGFFPTELTAPVYASGDQLQKLADSTAIGRNGELEDLDGISIFLASTDSDYITGQTIYVDGGFTAK